MKSQTKMLPLALSVCAIGLILLIAACSPTPTNVEETGPIVASTTQPAHDEEQEAEDHAADETHEEGEEHSEDAEHAEGEEHERIPNDGALIRIISPADGATFAADEEILVQIETENFMLGEEERHWELYVDGASWGSIEGGNTDEVVRGLEPGEHEITVYLSLGSHEQLADGSTIRITVTE